MTSVCGCCLATSCLCSIPWCNTAGFITAMCCLLYCVFTVVCCTLHVSVVFCVLYVVCCMLSVVCCVLTVVYCVLCVVFCVLYVVCCCLHQVCQICSDFLWECLSFLIYSNICHLKILKIDFVRILKIHFPDGEVEEAINVGMNKASTELLEAMKKAVEKTGSLESSRRNRSGRKLLSVSWHGQCLSFYYTFYCLLKQWLIIEALISRTS